MVWQVKIGGVEFPWLDFTLHFRESSPCEFSLSLQSLDGINLEDSIEFLKDGVTRFKGYIKRIKKVRGSTLRFQVSGRDLSDELFFKIKETKTYSEQKPIDVLSDLLSGSGISVGSIEDPWKVWHKWKQDTDTEFANSTLTNLKVSGSGIAAKIVFDDAIQNLDQYLDAGFDTGNALATDDYRMAQTFTPLMASPIAKVSLYIRRFGDPSSIFAEIRTVSGGVPTSTVLTSKTLSGSDVPTTLSWVDFLFETKPVLASGTQYAIVIGGTGINAYNGFSWSIDNDDGYPNGAWLYAEHGFDWSSPGARDAGFKTFMGAESGEAVTPLISPTNWLDWIEFNVEGANQGGSLTFDILDSLDNVLIANLTLNDLPKNISTITQSSIKLKAKFAWSVGETVSPELDLWFVSHHANYVNFKVDYETLYDAVKRLGEVLGAQWEVDSNGNLNFKRELGSDKSSSVIVKEENLYGEVSIERASEKLVNKLWVIGAGSGVNRLTKLVEDFDSQSTYGVKEGARIDRGLHIEDIAHTWGEHVLERWAIPQERVLLSIRPLFDFDVGDKIKLDLSTLGFSETLLVRELVIKVRRGGEVWNVGLGELRETLWDEILRERKMEGWFRYE